MKKHGLLLSLVVLSIILSLSGCTALGSISGLSDLSAMELEPLPEKLLPDLTSKEPVQSEVDKSAALIYLMNPQLTPIDYSSPAILPETEDMGMEYVDKFAFLCESTMYGFKFYGGLSDGKDTTQIVTGPQGTMTLATQSYYKIKDLSDGTEKTIRDYMSEHQPEYLMITIGLNGVSFMDEDYFYTEYNELVTDIQELCPDTTIVLQSVFPIHPIYKHYGEITNPMISDCNTWILRIAEETGCSYLDTYSVMIDEDGNLKKELQSGDGIHFNTEGLSVMLDYIRTHAVTE